MIDSLELNKEGLIHKLTDSIEVLQHDGKESLFSDHETEEYESLGYITTDSIENISNLGIENTRFTNDNGIKTTVDEKGKTNRRVFSNENVLGQNKPVSLSDILFNSRSSSVQPTTSAEPTSLNEKADCQSSSEVIINNTTDNVIPLTENSSTQSKTALEELIRNVNQTFAIDHNSVTKSKQEKEKLVSKEKIMNSIEQNLESVNIPLNEKQEADNQKRKCEEIEANAKKLKSEEILEDASKKEVNVNVNQESDTNLVKESSESNSEFINEEILIDKKVIDLKIKATENQIYDNHIKKNHATDRTDFFRKSEKVNTSDKQFNGSEKKPKETCESKGLQNVMPPTAIKQTQHEVAINKIENSVERKSLKSPNKVTDPEPNSDIEIKDRDKHLEINHKLKCEKLLANNMNGKESSSISEIKLDEKGNLTSTAKEINQNPSVVELRESTKQTPDENSQPEQSVEYNDSKQNTKETYEDLSKKVSSSSLIKADEENKSKVLQIKSKENNESGLQVEQIHKNVVNGQNSRYNESKPMLEETQRDAGKSVSIKESVKSQYQVLKTIENNYSEQRNVMPSTSTEQKQHEMAINTIQDSVERKCLKSPEKLTEIEPNTNYIKNPEKPLEMNHKSNTELLANNLIGKDSSDISGIELNEEENLTPTAKEINQNQSVVVELRESTKQSVDCRNNQPEPPVEYQENNVAKGQNTIHNDSKQNTEETHEDVSENVSSNSLTNVDKENELKVKSRENKESGLRVEQNQNLQYNESKPILEETQGDASKRVSTKENVKNESQVLQEKAVENTYNVVNNVETHENLSKEIPNGLQRKIDEQELHQNDIVGGQNKLLPKEIHEHLNKEILSGLQIKVNETNESEVLENKSTENNHTEKPIKQQNDVGEDQNKLAEKNHEYLSKEIPSGLQTKVDKPEVLEVKSTKNLEQKCEKTFRGETTETFQNFESQFKGEKTDKPKFQQNQEELVPKPNHKINKEISLNSEEIDKVQKVPTTVDTSSTCIKEYKINKTDINQNTCSKEEQEQITEKYENDQEQGENKYTSKRAENHESSRNNNITEKQSSKIYIDEKDPVEVTKILNLKTSVIENELNDIVSNVTENKINTVQQTSEEYLQLDSKLRTDDVLKDLSTNNTIVDTNNESSIKTKETDQTKVSENINQDRKAEAEVNKLDTKDCTDLLKESEASMFPETKEPSQNNLTEVVTLEADKKELIISQTKSLDVNLLEKHQQESAVDERQDTQDFENQCKEKQSKENLESKIKGGSATFEPLVINNGKTMVEKAREKECNISYVRQDTKEFENLERQYAEFDQNINQLKTEDILGELVSKCGKKDLEADNTRIYYRQDTREFEMLEKEFAETTSAINSPIIKGAGEGNLFYRQDTEEFENLERQFKANAQNHNLVDDILGELVSQSTSGVERNLSISSTIRPEGKINMEQAEENGKSVSGNDKTIQIDNKISQCVKISNKLEDLNKNNRKEIDTEKFEDLEKQCKTTIQKDRLNNDILGELMSQNASTTDVEGNLYTTNFNQAEGKINQEKTKDNVTVSSGNINNIITQINKKNNQPVEIPNKLDDQDQSTNHIESEEMLDVSIKKGVIEHPLDKTGNEIPFDDQQLSINETAKINLQGEKVQEWTDKSLINDDKQEDYKNKPLNAPGESINKKKPINRVEIRPNIRNKQVNTKLISSNNDEVKETNQQFSNTNEELKTKVELLQQELDSIKKSNRRKDQSVVTSTTEKEVDKGVIFKYR